MKYGISLYDAFQENPALFQSFLDNTFNERYNAELWKEFFDWDDMPSSDDMFKVIEVVDSGVVMADVRARFSEINQRDVDGYAFHSGSIPDLSHGYEQKVADLTKIKRMETYLNGDVNVLRQLTNQLDKLILGVHARITNMAMQLLSTGKIESNGNGLPYKTKFPIPTSNFKTAGATAWSDPDALIFDDMINIEDYVINTLGYTGPKEWIVDRTTMNYILKNKQVQSMVAPIIIASGIATAPTTLITESQLNAFLLEWKQVSPIRVIDSKQREASLGSVATVNGWAESVAVLKPAGLAGVVKYSMLEELDAVSNESNILVGYVEDGKIGIKRKFSVDKEVWSTSVLAAAVPALTEWNYHIIVDTSETGS